MDLHYVYLIRCADNSLYCGYTNDLEKRFKMHCQNKGAKYTRVLSRHPLVLVYHESYESKSLALKRECAIKRLTKKQKEKLLVEGNICKY